MYSSDFSDVPFGDLPVVECTGHAINDEGYGNSYDGAHARLDFCACRVESHTLDLETLVVDMCSFVQAMTMANQQMNPQEMQRLAMQFEMESAKMETTQELMCACEF